MSCSGSAKRLRQDDAFLGGARHGPLDPQLDRRRRVLTARLHRPTGRGDDQCSAALGAKRLRVPAASRCRTCGSAVPPPDRCRAAPGARGAMMRRSAPMASKWMARPVAPRMAGSARPSSPNAISSHGCPPSTSLIEIRSPGSISTVRVCPPSILWRSTPGPSVGMPGRRMVLRAGGTNGSVAGAGLSNISLRKILSVACLPAVGG